jgi:hypothetical protein
MTRHAAAQVVPTQGQLPNKATNSNAALAGMLGSFLGSLRPSSANLLGTYDGRSAQPWDVTPYGESGPTFNNPSAYVSSAIDGLAYNPTTSSAFDAMANSTVQSDSVGFW